MNLLYKVIETGTTIPILEQFMDQSIILYQQILHNLKYETHQTKQLEKIDISSLFKDITKREYELDSELYSFKIMKYLSKIDNNEYNVLLSRFTPLEIICKVLKEYNTQQNYIFKYKTNTIKFKVFIKNSIELLDITTKATKIFLFMELLEITNKTVNINYFPTQFPSRNSVRSFFAPSG